MKYSLKGVSRCCVVICASGLLTAPAAAVDIDHAVLVELDAQRTSLRGAGQHSLETDTSVATLELALAARLDPHWSADLVVLAEDIGVTDSADYIPYPDATDKRPDRLHIDTFTLGYTHAAFEAAAGRMTLPFGRFQTALLSDPLTLVAGETATEAGARALYRRGEAYLGGAVFNGNLRSVAPDEAGYVAFAGWETEPVQLQFGYLSAQYAGERAPALVDLAASFLNGRWFATAEFVGAAQARAGQRPRTLHAEAGYAFAPRWDLALRHQQTWRFPVLPGGTGRYREWALGANHALTEQVAVGIEHAAGVEGGLRQRTTQVRLAIEF